jgi:hypothetical protein
VLRAFALRAGTVQNLLLPTAARVPLQTQVVFDGVERTLFLTPNDPRAADFQFLLEDAHGIHRLPTPAAVTFGGTLSGLAGAEVAATLVDGQLRATIHTAARELWAIEPVTEHLPHWPRETHVLYRARDVVGRDVRCGVTTPAPIAAPAPTPAPAALRVAEIAIDADVRFYALSNNSATTVASRVMAVVNAVNVIYRRDVEIEFNVTTILVRTTNVYAWNGDLCNLLGQFRTRWNSNHTAIRRDLAHLFTGEGAFGGVIGCAYVGVICGTSGYGASKAYSGSLATDVGLVAHEIGHNWNAPHCDAQGTCHIMCSGLGGCSGVLGSFEPYSANIIIAHRNSRACLSNPVAPTLSAIAPNTVTSWAPPQVELTGTEFSSVTSVTVAGVPVTFALTSPTTLRFTPRAPFTLGTHPVVVSNSIGTSAPLSLTVVGNHPCVLELSPVLLRGFPLPLTMRSDAGWVGLPYLSFSNAPSVVPGLVNLGIGNAFAELIQLSFLVAGGNGSASYGLALPQEAPPGAYIYTQLVAFNPANIVLPLEVSNVVRSEIR